MYADVQKEFGVPGNGTSTKESEVGLIRSKISDANDRLQAAVDASRETSVADSPLKVPYHVWSVVGDLGYDLERLASDSSCQVCRVIFAVLQYMEENVSLLVEVAETEPHPEGFKSENPSFEELRQMRAIVRASVYAVLDAATNECFGALLHGIERLRGNESLGTR